MTKPTKKSSTVKPLTKSEKTALFKRHDDFMKQLDALEERRQSIIAERSAHVKKMVDALDGQVKWPLVHAGQRYSPSHRGETWYFKITADENYESID